MKAGRSKESKAVKASGKSGLKTRSARVKNSSKKANKSDHKARGCSEELLYDKENQHFPVKESGGLCPEPPTEDTFHVKLKEALEVDLHPRQTLTSSAKIKLQLFPGKLPAPCTDLSFLSLRINFNDSKEISAALCLLRSSPNLRELEILARPEERSVAHLWEEVYLDWPVMRVQH